MPGTNLLQTLTMPCNMTLTQSYESQRDLPMSMAYRRGTTLVAQRSYSYDSLGRPLTRSTARNGQTVNDSFVHNSRSELASATVNGASYGYGYDNIGNLRMAMEASDYTLYEANALNQYTSIQENEEAAFTPTFDTDGNQTLVKTTTGIWTVAYDAENRPVSFTNAESNTVIECSYDYMGRCATKKLTINGNITLHQRFIYRGYQQIACCDLTRSNHPCLWLITWDPSQPVATRPLAIQKDGTWYTYGWDLTKNICEVYGQHGYMRTAYTYTPYGEVTSRGDVEQPIQWSGEHNDTELGLVYYNYRYYNPVDGRWIRRDDIDVDFNDFLAFENNPLMYWDILGHYTDSVSLEVRKMLLQGYSPEEITKFLLAICAVKSASEADKLIKRELQFKGERNHTARPDGGDNPYKHTKSDPNDPNSIIRRDPQTGKKKKQKKPKDYDQKRGKNNRNKR